ncbi:diguanylate cyclase [Aquabacter sp. CN5-332]|uniref:GGDEF domain-containing protein n=1 Tax=Aquabacter sp. CN5-332 TaxID=3156608 RepID=UPI0032B57EE8
MRSSKANWKGLSPFFLLSGCLLLTGLYLVLDFRQERARIIDDAARLALQKSQLIGRSFGDTFLAADYVLRDVIGRVDVSKDLSYPPTDPSRTDQLRALLREKAQTMTGLVDLALLDDDCTFVAVGYHPVEGRKSIQTICRDARIKPGQSLHFEYMTAKNSHSGRPVILMTRLIGSPDGHLVGAAMAVIDLDFAQGWISTVDADSNDVLCIVDTDGLVIARKPSLPSDTGYLYKAAFLSALRAPTSSSADIAGDGRKRIAGIAPLEQVPFASIVAFDLDRVLREWRHRAWQFAIGFLALAGLSVLALRGHLDVLKQREKAHRLANLDPLTGIYNRRYFMEAGSHEFDRAKRYDRPLSVLVVDIDNFKNINDCWGHPTGDVAIQAAANSISSVVRDQDLVARLGGEEFSVILPETDPPRALAIGERLRASIATTSVTSEDGTSIRFTVSIGVSSLQADDPSFQAMSNRADKALYRAKESGRNRVIILDWTHHGETAGLST